LFGVFTGSLVTALFDRAAFHLEGYQFAAPYAAAPPAAAALIWAPAA